MKNKAQSTPDRKVDTTLEEVKTSLLPYPSGIGSLNFSPTPLGGRFIRGRKDLQDRVKNSLQELADRAQHLKQYYQDSERVYSAEIRFTPVVGHIYHLYQTGGREWVSLISPGEWNQEGYIGSYRYDGEGWEEVG